MKYQSEFDYANFGTHDVDEPLSLTFANNEIQISKTNTNQFQYMRISSDSHIRHALDVGDDVKIHICPMLPLNVPEPITSLLYLDLQNPILVGKSVSAEISLKCPIEIGVFAKTPKEDVLVDSFSCDPLLSKFALYGLPTDGDFCKYSKIDDKEKIKPYHHAVVNVKIKNNLDHAVKVGKIVFDASSQNVYYSNNKIIVDSISMEINDEKHATLTVSPCSDNLEKSLRTVPEKSQPFVMDSGYD
ncbi:DUF432 domain-containing protein [Nitrosopumilus maritimus]|nr:DUF432 domain-containing protein [Nitrosopumilus maritimus]